MKKTPIQLLFTMLLAIVIVAGCGNNAESNGASPTASESPKSSEAAASPEAASSEAASPEASKELRKITVQLGWFAEPEYGGDYAALVKGYFAEEGLDVTIKSGGPKVNGRQIVATGNADFGFAKADTVLQNREEGLPIVAVAGALQSSPQALIFHKDQNIKTFEDLNGRTAFFVPGVPAYEYVKKKYNLQLKEQVTDGTLVRFLEDKTSLLHGFATSEPITLKEQGIEAQPFLLSESGYDPYEITIITSESFLKDNPEVVKAYLRAVKKGWAYYFDNAEEINVRIHEDNKDLPIAAMNEQAIAYKPYVTGGDAATEGFGIMKEARWEENKKQLLEVGLLKKDVDVNEAFTTEYLPK
ncbi:ABC transporter substrate-binding protein [Cohnella herbarum]|uniref:ABC transporter substrate-binding protein n=1 Tax=Cohnella herbarum TaxID=2728023 RepID=A0A7Z2ZPV1_9BACL|nr:ABC transporter substrate-binding protein [Cohnella herbarum]QJD87574.1 ABC transporter substrate-binding protein [Cohnella herbarum]